VGTPDLVIEILSPATEARDRREKRALYDRFGIPEFWIVSPNGFMEAYPVDEQGRYPAPTSPVSTNHSRARASQSSA
jgi:Uma2 family endonuclease